MYGSALVAVVLVYLSVDVHRNIVRVNENSDWQLHELRRSINTEINILEISYASSYTLPDVKYHNATALFHVSTKNKKSAYSHSNKHVHSKKQNFL